MRWLPWICLGGCFVVDDPDLPTQCEAVCDWAVACHAGDRSVDPDLAASCLAATGDASDTCDRAPTALVRTCVEAVERAADNDRCNAFTGSLDQIKSATPVAECLAAGPGAATDIFEAAKDATAETSAQLCTRLTDTFCQTTTRCVLGEATLPDGLVESLGGTPDALCAERLDAVFTASCTERDLYAPETRIEEVNPTRQAARECLPTLAATECDGLLGTDPQALIDSLDPLCLGVASTPEDLRALASVLIEVAGDVAETLDKLPAR